MKTIRYFFFVALGSVLMAADCSNKDNEFYNDVHMTSTDLVQVENQSQLRSWRHPMDQYRQFLSLFNRT
jgi:hypothetical protein